jgi:hypothetical protein
MSTHTSATIQQIFLIPSALQIVLKPYWVPSARGRVTKILGTTLTGGSRHRFPVICSPPPPPPPSPPASCSKNKDCHWVNEASKHLVLGVFYHRVIETVWEFLPGAAGEAASGWGWVLVPITVVEVYYEWYWEYQDYKKCVQDGEGAF